MFFLNNIDFFSDIEDYEEFLTVLAQLNIKKKIDYNSCEHFDLVLLILSSMINNRNVRSMRTINYKISELKINRKPIKEKEVEIVELNRPPQ